MNKQSIFNKRRFSIILGLVLVLLAASATMAFAQAVATGDGSITACLYRDGSIYITTTGTCKKGYTPLTWNIMGPQGEPGAQGEQGPQGEPGPQGDAGPQGPEGPAGQDGATGPQGEQGPAGADGLSAYDLAKGSGFLGSVEQWLASLVGPKGDRGEAGPQGPQGERGLQGVAGQAGATGEQGEPGLACWDLNGNGAPDTVEIGSGFTEDMNHDGKVDILDCKGDQGEVGAQGPAGPTGPQGPQGERGLPGLTGPQGPKGDPGAVGATGPTGPAGANGLACWDLDSDGEHDAVEDINHDSVWDARDCTSDVNNLQVQVDSLQGLINTLTEQLNVQQAKLDHLWSLTIKTVFVTSTQYNGNLGGLYGADQKCQELARVAGLPGTYMAWLADNSNSPATRFTHSDLPYLRVDGVKVADSWADLTDGNLDAKIDVDEQGNTHNDLVWTGAAYSGVLSGINCANWKSQTSFDQGDAGLTSDFNRGWSFNTISSCDVSNRLYCFQQ